MVAALLASTLVTRADAAEVDLREVCPELLAEEVFKKESRYGPSGAIIARFVGFNEFRRSAALIIGVGTYDKLTRLEAPTADADRMRDFLIDGAGFDYVVTLKDERASLDLIHCLMDTAFPELLGGNDRFLFYFSGHGTQRPAGQGTVGYLALKNSGLTAYHTMIEMGLVERWSDFLSDTRHTLFVLDACFSGLAGIQRKTDEITKKRLQQLKEPSHYLITAGTAEQESVASVRRWGGSLFTTALLEAASGRGDAGTQDYPADGVVSLKEIVRHVEDRIADEASKNPSINMSPQMSVLQANEGEFFFLAREHLNKRAGNAPETKLARGEPVQTKAAQASVQVELESVERPGSLISTTNIRAEPSSNSAKVATLNSGTQVYVAGQVRGQPWYFVERDGEPLGYVFARNVALEANRPPKPTETTTGGQPAAPPSPAKSATQDPSGVQQQAALPPAVAAEPKKPPAVLALSSETPSVSSRQDEPSVEAERPAASDTMQTAGIPTAPADTPIDSSRWRIGEKVIVDLKTSLMWTRGDLKTISGRFTNNWDDAIRWVEEMNRRKYAGYSDWKLASIAEYRTIYGAPHRQLFQADEEDYYWARNEINKYVASYINFNEGWAVSGEKSGKRNGWTNQLFKFSGRLVRKVQ
jgi:hypothetical protein